jgi:hypothetical protein
MEMLGRDEASVHDGDGDGDGKTDVTYLDKGEDGYADSATGEKVDMRGEEFAVHPYAEA